MSENLERLKELLAQNERTGAFLRVLVAEEQLHIAKESPRKVSEEGVSLEYCQVYLDTVTAHYRQLCARDDVVAHV